MHSSALPGGSFSPIGGYGLWKLVFLGTGARRTLQFGFLLPAQAMQHSTVVAVRPGVVGKQLQRSLIVFERGFKFLRGLKSPAAILKHLVVVRGNLNRLRQNRDCLS